MCSLGVCVAGNAAAAQSPPPEGSKPCVVIHGKACTFSFALDALEVVGQLASDFIPASRDDKVGGRRGVWRLEAAANQTMQCFAQGRTDTDAHDMLFILLA